jgi:hypothetical protein
MSAEGEPVPEKPGEPEPGDRIFFVKNTTPPGITVE